jgi:ketosteroid isomerase-like protein
MSEHAATIRRFWQTTEARDWDGLSEVLAPEMVYEMEQTRERIRGREGFLRFFSEYPGDWHLTVRRVIADADGGASVCDFTVGDEQMLDISFFTFDGGGLISRVDDVWPEPYEPPADRAQVTERF